MEIPKTWLTILILGILLTTLTISSSGQLTSASASEGTCVWPQPIEDPATWAFIFTYPGTWNIPIGSQFMIRKYAEILLGAPAADETQLDEMNLTAQCQTLDMQPKSEDSAPAQTCSLTGYSRTVVQNCTPSTYDFTNPAIVTSFTCPYINVPLGSTPANSSAIRSFDPLSDRSSVIYTDLTNTLVLNKCIDGTQRGFFVLSKSPTLTADQNNTVFNLLVNAGYDSSEFYYS